MDGFETIDGILLPTITGAVDAAIYGIRPEHLHFSDDGFAIEVAVLEPTGSETQVVGRLGSQTITGIFRERVSVAPGTIVKVKPNLSAVHLFDKDGRRAN